MERDDPRIQELTIALEKAERKITERETLLSAAMKQTEDARSQYEQASERLEAMRRRLAVKEEQSNSLITQIKNLTTEVAARDQHIATLQQELQRRDEGIATLARLNEEADDAPGAIGVDKRLHAMGLVLESLDDLNILHRIGKPVTTLGRSVANDVMIRSASVSRHHARLDAEVDAIYLVDLESTNGCKVNGQRIIRQAISDGDVIAIGNAQFQLKVGAPRAYGEAGFAMGVEDRSMDETFPLLNDSAILIPTPSRAKSGSVSELTTKKSKS
jgi:hypothetical protein